jgi:hypothetical protein
MEKIIQAYLKLITYEYNPHFSYISTFINEQIQYTNINYSKILNRNRIFYMIYFTLNMINISKPIYERIKSNCFILEYRHEYDLKYVDSGLC